MNLKTFNEICEIAYFVRTDNQRQNGTFDWWVTGENADSYKFEKKPLQRAYLIFTKKGTFMRDRAYAGRDDMRHAAESFYGFMDGNPSEHDYNAALASVHAADAGAKKAALAYRQIQERMVFQPAFVFALRALSRRLERIFEPLLADWADVPYSHENAVALREAFNQVYDRDANDEGAWQTEDDMFVEARRLHNGSKWPLYFLNSEWEEKHLDVWEAWDLREGFIGLVDRLHTIADRCLVHAEAATDGGKWERAKRELVYLHDELLDSPQMYGAVKQLARETVSASSEKRSTLYQAWQQMIEARDYWRTALDVVNTQKNAANGRDTLVGACEVAIEKLSLVRSARYKVHVVGQTPFLRGWVADQGANY